MASPDSQLGKHPPATPVYILRGHAAPVNALHFYNQNARLVSGDADGWTIVWNTTTKRPTAVWKAHEGAILNVLGVAFASDDAPHTDKDAGGAEQGEETQVVRVFTHGRDIELRVWRLNTEDEASLDKGLPVEEADSLKDRSKPELIYSITVNALNFCGFALAFEPGSTGARETAESCPGDNSSVQKPPLIGHEAPRVSSQIFIAVPNALNTGGIDIFHLPSQKRVCIIYADKSVNTGMVMALGMHISSTGNLYVVSGYEDGQVMVHLQRGPIVLQKGTDAPTSSTWEWNWEKLYTNRAHSQPVLSLDISPGGDKYFLTSSADAMIVKHPLPISENGSKPETNNMPLKIVNTKHAGQQGLKIRSDEKIFVTAGWDGRARVYSCKTMKELAVLKWHKEGCYAIALASIVQSRTTTQTDQDRTTEVTTEQPGNRTLVQRGQPGSLAAIKQQRDRRAQLANWVAVGSKDGKISLWDIY